ncbi:hypothetical protein L2E82_27330 [Cichorium intybus]|uniref:Uncharacterized protein n=1 Tax=Cichorium intybus TaxID=13427 RepID=A0ACB9CSP5_CICIN|nr:hypothetical protein L2E82_27330 [Cichorium intybus]
MNIHKLRSGISSQVKQAQDGRSNSSSGTSVLDQEQSAVDDANICSTSPICAAPICRQFWKAGIYNDHLTPKFKTQSGSSYLHIHPRFLHSNATSHKWVFGAVAELIDNAVDEIQNGATYAIIDKTINPRNGSSALLIQDDGGGMNPEAMRHCLSFGFSDKKSISSIGKYGNGFKTSSMRLGADVIVFSRNMTNRKLTQSIGLLSYTFLTQKGYDKIVVPMVHYDFNFITGTFNSVQSKSNDNNSNLNLSMMLQWSPYSTEEELLKQFEDIGSHGTKVIIYNLWLDEDRNLELDFESDPEDIRITRDAHRKMKDGSRQAASEQHIANRLRYSLRAYLSILYLKLPENFAMVLRGKVVLYHNISIDLKYTEFIVYKPQTTVVEVELIDYNDRVYQGGAICQYPWIQCPFWPVVSFGSNRGRGVVVEPRGFQQGSNLKRKSCDQPTTFISKAPIEVYSNKRSNLPGLANTQEAINATHKNRNLRARCLEYEKTQEQLNLKVTQLKMELREVQTEYGRVLGELLYLEKVKGETCV